MAADKSVMPRLLDLYCKAGGASVGYHRAGFEVVGVDIEPQPRYPFAFVLMDALEALRLLIAGECITDNRGRQWFLADFDVIAGSPPCQLYTGMRKITISRFGHAPDHPDLIGPTRTLLEQTGKPWVIENVQNSPVKTTAIVCGVSVGLPHLARHRHFESNVFIYAPRCSHRSASYTIGVYGERPDGRRVSYRHNKLSRIARGLEEAEEVMGIDWMTWEELKNAIPPAYTELIGRQLIGVVTNGC